MLYHARIFSNLVLIGAKGAQQHHPKNSFTVPQPFRTEPHLQANLKPNIHINKIQIKPITNAII
jgi:hypothetical protein